MQRNPYKVQASKAMKRLRLRKGGREGLPEKDRKGREEERGCVAGERSSGSCWEREMIEGKWGKHSGKGRREEIERA